MVLTMHCARIIIGINNIDLRQLLRFQQKCVAHMLISYIFRSRLGFDFIFVTYRSLNSKMMSAQNTNNQYLKKNLFKTSVDSTHTLRIKVFQKDLTKFLQYSSCTIMTVFDDLSELIRLQPSRKKKKTNKNGNSNFSKAGHCVALFFVFIQRLINKIISIKSDNLSNLSQLPCMFWFMWVPLMSASNAFAGMLFLILSFLLSNHAGNKDLNYSPLNFEMK